MSKLDEILDKMIEQNQAAYGEPHVDTLVAALKKCCEQRDAYIAANWEHKATHENEVAEKCLRDQELLKLIEWAAK